MKNSDRLPVPPTAEIKYQPGSIGWMSPQLAEMVEQLLAERNALEVSLSIVREQRDALSRIADLIEPSVPCGDGRCWCGGCCVVTSDLPAVTGHNNEKPRVRSASYLSPPDMHRLDWACVPVAQSFRDRGHRLYMVGSVMERPDFRDIDVRLILDDEQAMTMFPTAAVRKLFDVAVSDLIANAASLPWPIDFQVQSMTEANVPEHGMRNPIGLGRGYR